MRPILVRRHRLVWSRRKALISVSVDEIREIRDVLRQIGFEPGATPGKINRQAVVKFQEKYGLTVDALIGKQTLSALQRELDARRKSKQAGTGAASGAAVAGGNLNGMLKLQVRSCRALPPIRCGGSISTCAPRRS